MEQLGFYRAGIYCRLSQDDGQTGDSSSIQTQKYMLEKYCDEQGFQINDFYVDDGYSGLNFNRPDFQRLLNDIDAKKVNLVIQRTCQDSAEITYRRVIIPKFFSKQTMYAT